MHKPPLVLIVDDDSQIIDLFTTKLKSAGFSVAKAYNGKDGIESAKTQKPDLILLDLKMPVMDGAEALQRLHDDPETKGLKVAILSSFNDWSAIKMNQETAKALGAIDFIEKGIDLNELVTKVKSFI